MPMFVLKFGKNSGYRELNIKQLKNEKNKNF